MSEFRKTNPEPFRRVDVAREDQLPDVDAQFRKPLSWYRRKAKTARSVDEVNFWYDALEARMREIDEEREVQALHDQVREIEKALENIAQRFDAALAADEEKQRQAKIAAKENALRELFDEVEAIGRQRQREAAAQRRQARIFGSDAN